MKIILTEQQYKLLIELNVDDLETDETKDNNYGDSKWFDYHGYYSYLFKDNPENLKKAIDDTMNYLNNEYDVKKIVLKDNGNTVAFIVYSKTTFKKEDEYGNSKYANDENEYDIILSTAIHPDYRGKGLLNLMIKKANIIKPFLIHTSDLTTPGVWEKYGCKPILNIYGGQLQFCK